MVAVVRVKSPRSAVAEAVRAAVVAACGPTGSSFGDSIKLLVGTLAMSKIQQWFEIKADGGTDPAGLKWKDLTPETKAYSRRIPGYKRKAVGEKPFGLLTKPQQELWDKEYRKAYARFAFRLPQKEAAAAAGRIAWSAVKRAGGKTLIGVYGGRNVKILRDTGVLLSSLSPGSTSEGSEDRILQPIDGGVVVGTNVAYAAKMNATRPLWPDPDTWPESVWVGIAVKVAEATAEHLALTLPGGGRNA